MSDDRSYAERTANNRIENFELDKTYEHDLGQDPYLVVTRKSLAPYIPIPRKSISIPTHLQDLILGIANGTHVLTSLESNPSNSDVLCLTIIDPIYSNSKCSIDIDPSEIRMLLDNEIISYNQVWIHSLDHTENYHYQYFVQELPE